MGDHNVTQMFLTLRTGNQAFPKFFSGCSVEQLAEFMERARPDCLADPGGARSVAVGPSCGNALLDAGEECDCGAAEVNNTFRRGSGHRFLF